jgi:hypothetical protein
MSTIVITALVVLIKAYKSKGISLRANKSYIKGISIARHVYNTLSLAINTYRVIYKGNKSIRD